MRKGTVQWPNEGRVPAAAVAKPHTRGRDVSAANLTFYGAMSEV
jgi:hypothetical protein